MHVHIMRCGDDSRSLPVVLNTRHIPYIHASSPQKSLPNAQEVLQHVNTLRHEVDVVLVWLEQVEVGLEDKQVSLQAQQDAKQADAQDRQRVLLGEVVAAVMAGAAGERG